MLFKDLFSNKKLFHKKIWKKKFNACLMSCYFCKIIIFHDTNYDCCMDKFIFHRNESVKIKKCENFYFFFWHNEYERGEEIKNIKKL